MNTTDFYKAIASELDISKAEAERLTRATLECFQEVLVRRESVSIPDLGTFDTHLRAARESFSPHLKQYVELPKKRVVDFRPAVGFKKLVRNTEVSDEQ